MERKETGTLKALLLCVLMAMFFSLGPGQAAAAEQQFFKMGDFRLEGGGMIRDCILGYRTLGRLNGSRSNAVVFPTWFMGTSADLEALIGPGKLVDTSRYFVIAVDAFGNGVSSSPSNSPLPGNALFPEFTIGDMVRAQHRLVTEGLGIKRLHAVIGISMGGMQTFQWVTAYPGSTDKAVPITGTPRPTSYDLLLYRTGLAVLDDDGAAKPWDGKTLTVATGILAMASETPAHFIATHDRAGLSSYVEKGKMEMQGHDPRDIAWQLKAMIRHDVYGASGEPAEVARKITSKVFTVISTRDLMVNPQPARELAGLLGSPPLVLDSSCGHYVLQCEEAKITTAVSRFLNE